jgi:hypothetical protein
MACPGVAGWALDTSLDAHCGPAWTLAAAGGNTESNRR